MDTPGFHPRVHGFPAKVQKFPAMDINQAIAELRPLNEPVPKPAPLPTEADVSAAERKLGLKFPADFRSYLLEASDVVYGTKEPCQIAPGRHRDLSTTAQEAWQQGVPRTWLPFCEDNGDYYCLDGSVVRYWSHEGSVDEHWPDLATWIVQVWIGESA
jgi:hypothetical protein